MISWYVSGFCHPPGVSYSPAALKFSTNRSCTAGFRLVNPQAMRWLCPTTTRGIPGKVNPSTSNSPEWSCNSYHTAGMRCGRCISFESSGFPVVVCAPETTQLFDPGTHDSQSLESREELPRATATRRLVTAPVLAAGVFAAAGTFSAPGA